MQFISNKNTFCTSVRSTEDVPVLTLKLQSISSVYEIDTRLALSN